MKRVTITFSLDIEDEAAFVAAADERCLAAWGDRCEDYADDGEPVLVRAVIEYFLSSDGPWPEGVASDANFDASGYVREV